MPFLLVFSLALLLVARAVAHSWIECLDTDRAVVFDHAAAFIYGGQHAAGLCQGYQRNYRGRGVGIHDEDLMVKILKDDYKQPDVRVCKPGAADPTSNGFHKRIAVAPGQHVFFAYMPNGHVVVDKAARGTLYGLYWTQRQGDELQFTSELTDDKLLDGVRHDFDDGVCGQTFANKTTRERSGRAGDDFPCVGDFVIPQGTPPGVYAVVWMWKFWDERNDQREIVTVGGKFGGAAYSSCFDVEVIAGEAFGSDDGRANETAAVWTS